ncbi:hypothetical protein [Flavobacterium haoranii]|nr:hypothetical protein [Flavobacterium haoranii]
MISKLEYEILKSNVLKLEKEYGYEPEFKYKLIDKSFLFEDFDFFKEELSILVKNYGFQVTFMNENESYYNSIMFGKLSKWFKKMYLKNHLYWLKHNFEKQLDIKTLNELPVKDQVIAKYSADLQNQLNLDSIQKNKFIEITANYYFKNIDDLLYISKKYDELPSTYNLGLVQNYRTVLIHNFRENTNKTWNLLFPYIKKSYMKNQITNVIFQDFDFYCYLKNGFQKFNSFKINQIPPSFRKNGNEIPIEDKEFLESFKKEVNWEN